MNSQNLKNIFSRGLSQIIPHVSGFFQKTLDLGISQLGYLIKDVIRCWVGLICITGSTILFAINDGTGQFLTPIMNLFKWDIDIQKIWWSGALTLLWLSWTSLIIGHGFQQTTYQIQVRNTIEEARGNANQIYAFLMFFGALVFYIIGVTPAWLMIGVMLAFFPFFIKQFDEQGRNEMPIVTNALLILASCWFLGI